MTKIQASFFSLLLFLGCSERRQFITIVDIGNNDRLEIGRQLRIVNQYSPKIVALDFNLFPDSLDRDTILVKELNKINHSVQVVTLYNFIEPLEFWDSLKISHPKFKPKYQGFANVTCDEDKVLEKELPMAQFFRKETIHSFSYVVASNSFGVKSKYRDTGTQYLKLNLKSIRKSYKIITRTDLATGNFNKEDLDNKIVLLGYIGPNEDFFYLDDDRTKKINGVEIQAAIIDEILDR